MSSMKIQFYIRGFRDNAALRLRLREKLDRLAEEIMVSNAAVVIERDMNGGPRFRAAALLAVPGPDIRREARDHTLEAAWLKVTTALGREIKKRKMRQILELKKNGEVRPQREGRTGMLSHRH